MTDNKTNPHNEYPPLASLLIIIGAALLSLIISNLMGMLLLLPFYGNDFQAVQSLIIDPASQPGGRYALLFIQAIGALGCFVLVPILFLYWAEHKIAGYLNSNKLSTQALILAMIIVLVSMPINALVIHWNNTVHLPDFFAGFEEWAMVKEEELKQLTNFITDFKSPMEFIIGFIVIAIIPGIGEELLFRGVIQPKIASLLGNKHVAIWLTAFIFSAIHLQFYGFVPRMLLGALFGYLYVWSGHIMVPMFAHFTNNGFTVIMYYLSKVKITNVDIEDVEQVPWSIALLSGVATIGLLYYFKNFYTKKHIS